MSNPYPFGQCTWWCANQQPWCLADGNLHDALEWAPAWRAHGGYVTSRPAVVGSIACFQPGADGADARFGHVAVVIAFDANGFTVSEMNGPAGPGRTDDRACSYGAGVSFLNENAPAPPPEEDDVYFLVTIAGDTTGTISRLGGGFYVHVVTPADEKAFQAAGDRPLEISRAQHDLYVAANAARNTAATP